PPPPGPRPGAPCGGSCPPSPGPKRPGTRSVPARPASSRSATRRPSSAGWSRSATGACPASCGGGTASPPGTARTATSRWPARTRRPAPPAAPASRPRTRTCSTPGSPAGCGRSRPSARADRRQPCGARDPPPDEPVPAPWFSSGLWPFSTLGWPDQTEDLAAFYPTSVLVTGYDIIFFWVARMLMFGCHFQPPTPFEVVAIHGMVRDAQGKKMSKSFGNVIDPIELMDRYGTDALRFALIRGANPGGDVPLAEEGGGGARNFANKLWSLGRFVIGSTGAPAGEPAPGGSLADRWLLSRLERTRAEVTAAYDAYDPAEAARLGQGGGR